MSTHITPFYRDVFRALTSGDFENFGLMSCFVDGQPACAIVALQERRNGADLWPIFVSITPAMALADHAGAAPGENVSLSAKFAWFASPRLLSPG